MSCYADFLSKLFAIPKVRKEPVFLSSMEKLCELHGNPQKKFATVHVAGTNGKGSVCTKIAAALSHQGYKTGLYTSPHLTTFRERIRIGQELLSEEEACSLFDALQKSLKECKTYPTFFEVTTLLAFLHFAKSGVDVAVIEAGIGGKNDATNVISPLLSVITSIGYDHTEFLGTSLESIAEEKAGIIKLKTPVVLGHDLPLACFQKKADQMQAPLYQSTVQSDSYDIENQAIAHLSLQVLSSQLPLSQEAIQAGLEATPPCRFERLKSRKEVIFDVAHNPHGFAKLLQTLSSRYPGKRLRFLLGFSKDKEIQESAHLLQEAAHAIHLVSTSNPRLAQVDELKNHFCPKKCFVHIEESIAQGIKRALEGDPEELLVITGSFFIMKEARQALGIKDLIDPFY